MAEGVVQFEVGDKVTLGGLQKGAQYNGCEGKVISLQANGRVGVAFSFEGTSKKLAVQPANLSLTGVWKCSGEACSALADIMCPGCVKPVFMSVMLLHTKLVTTWRDSF